jgi:ABC-2 type transport system ATP-binding protein
MTIVYTSHYMEEVQHLCPRIAILDAGKVVASDTIRNLLAAMPATATLAVDRVPPEFLDKLRSIPGIKKVTNDVETVKLETDKLGPVLPEVAGLCYQLGVKLTTLETIEPNLERVFLHLTGKTLRD